MKGVQISVVQKSQAHFVLLVPRCSGDCHLPQKIVNTEKAVKGTKKIGNDIGGGGGARVPFSPVKYSVNLIMIHPHGELVIEMLNSFLLERLKSSLMCWPCLDL